jgi:formate C-acetyltransferase
MSANLKAAQDKWEHAWRGFAPGMWRDRVNVREFIQRNYTPYEGDGSFLQGPTPRTTKMWETLGSLFAKEREKGILDVSQIPSSILAHAPGYIDKANELIVGLQTDAPLKRAIMPNGGWRVVAASLESYKYKPDEKIGEIFTKYRKTHNDGVFDAYTAQIRKARSSGIVTGLPDAYGRGRIVGDYRRVALYGVDFLIEDKKAEKSELDDRHSTEEVIRLREELAEQIPLAAGIEGNGQELRLRYLGTGDQRTRSRAVDLFRLPRRDQAAERCGDVRRAPVDVLGHLL